MGIIVISAANTFPIIVKLNNNDFIKKNIFLGINLLNESFKLCYKYLCSKDQMLL